MIYKFNIGPKFETFVSKTVLYVFTYLTMIGHKSKGHTYYVYVMYVDTYVVVQCT